MGVIRPWPQLPVSNKEHTNAAVVIIGAGISGMCMAIDLIKRNKCHNFIIVEKSCGVGGTWYDNKYPGCCCDVWSLLYSYSFEQNSEWTRDYPGQEEILSYLQRVASKYNLFKYIRFNSEVSSATWSDSASKWTVNVRVTGGKESEFTSGYTIAADFLVSAVGQLNVPSYPKIPGLHHYQGKMMHSSRWDWSYNLEGKRIAVIGNGASAAQIVPEVAKVAKQLTVYQRTPGWVIPRHDGPTPTWKQWLFKYCPPIRWRVRAKQMDFRETFYTAVTDADSIWAQKMRDFCAMQAKAAFPDQPEMWEKLIPKYSPGCKRTVISDDFYPTLAMEHVHLETRPITKITTSGIAVEAAEDPADNEHRDFDLIILATGFKTVEFLFPMKLVGSKGVTLDEMWKDGAQAYYGCTVPNMPNFGMFYGPNSNLGHNSLILTIEAESRYLNTLIAPILAARGEGKTLALSPREDLTAQWNADLQKRLNETSYADPRCTSWFKDPKTGRITTTWKGTAVDFQKALELLRWDDFVATGDAVGSVRGRKDAKIPRVVEETQVSDMTLMLGAAGVVGALVAWGLKGVLF